MQGETQRQVALTSQSQATAFGVCLLSLESQRGDCHNQLSRSYQQNVMPRGIQRHTQGEDHHARWLFWPCRVKGLQHSTAVPGKGRAFRGTRDCLSLACAPALCSLWHSCEISTVHSQGSCRTACLVHLRCYPPLTALLLPTLGKWAAYLFSSENITASTELSPRVAESKLMLLSPCYPNTQISKSSPLHFHCSTDL